MKDEPIITEDHVLNQYTREQLELIGAFNSVTMNRTRTEAAAQHEENMNRLQIEQQNITLKNLEQVLTSNREQMRPHQVYRAEVAYEIGSQQFKCQLPIMSAMHLGMEDEEMGDAPDVVPIVAYGDTPAMACDNFDAMWIGGPKNEQS